MLNAAEKLKLVVGANNVMTDKVDRVAYARDVTHYFAIPDLVVFAASKDQVAREMHQSESKGAAETRVEEAEETGASVLTTTCPFCTFYLREAGERSERNIKMMDFPEYVVKVLKL